LSLSLAIAIFTALISPSVGQTKHLVKDPIPLARNVPIWVDENDPRVAKMKPIFTEIEEKEKKRIDIVKTAEGKHFINKDSGVKTVSLRV